MWQVREARSLLLEQESEKWLSSDAVTREALRCAEQVCVFVCCSADHGHAHRSTVLLTTAYADALPPALRPAP